MRCQRDIFYLFRRALRDGYIFPPRGAADSSAGDRRRAGTFSRSPAARAASFAMSSRYLVHSQADCPNRGVRMLSAQGCLFCRAGDRRKALDDAARQAWSYFFPQKKQGKICWAVARLRQSALRSSFYLLPGIRLSLQGEASRHARCSSVRATGEFSAFAALR